MAVLAVGPILAERCDRDADKGRVHAPEVVRRKAAGSKDAGRPVFDEDIRTSRERAQGGVIDGDAAFPGKQVRLFVAGE